MTIVGMDDLAAVSLTEAVSEILSWDTEADWDAAPDTPGMVSDALADHAGATTAASGYAVGQTTDGTVPGQSTVQTNGLVGWWTLHEQTGPATDLSGNGNDGTVTGTTRGVVGKGGLTAYEFDGTDDILDMGSPAAVSGVDPVTVSFWFNPDIDISGGTAVDWQFIGKSGEWAIENDSGGGDGSTLAMGIWGDRLNTTQATWTAGTWYHVVYVVDSTGGVFEVYVNGGLDNSKAPGSSIASTTNGLYIGGEGANNVQYVDGTIADARIYNRALSAAEIQTLHDWGHGDYANPPGSSDGGVAYWSLDEDTGTTATDAWGTNDGTVSGATVGVSGVRDTAYSFDGTDDSIGISPAVSGQTSGTVSFWISPDFNGGDANQYRLYDEQGTGEFTFLKYTDGLLYAGWNTNADYRVTTDASTIFYQGVWSHLALTWDATETALYVNGARRSAGGSPTTDTMSSASIGKKADVANVYYAGDLDDVRLYNRALSPAEVHDLYRFGTRGRDMRTETVIA